MGDQVDGDSPPRIRIRLKPFQAKDVVFYDYRKDTNTAYMITSSIENLIYHCESDDTANALRFVRVAAFDLWLHCPIDDHEWAIKRTKESVNYLNQDIHLWPKPVQARAMKMIKELTVLTHALERREAPSEPILSASQALAQFQKDYPRAAPEVLAKLRLVGRSDDRIAMELVTKVAECYNQCAKIHLPIPDAGALIQACYVTGGLQKKLYCTSENRDWQWVTDWRIRMRDYLDVAEFFATAL